MIRKSDIVRYAKAHPKSTTLLENGKLRFTATGMDFPSSATTAMLTAYENGKAMRRALLGKENELYDFEQHLPYIVPHPKRDKKHFLWCKLTSVTLPRNASKVKGHVRGRRFQIKLREAQLAKAEYERIAKVREEKRQKAKAFRQKKAAEKDADTTMRDNESEKDESVDEGDGGAEYDEDDDERDVLSGILSDSGDEMALDQEMDTSAKREKKTGDTDMEDVEEDKDTFWTRGKQDVRTLSDDEGNDGDDSDEWGAPQKPKSKRRKEGKRQLSRTRQAKDMDSALPEAPHMETPEFDHGSDAAGSPGLTGKRARTEKKVPRKMRRKRQRQRVAVTQT